MGKKIRLCAFTFAVAALPALAGSQQGAEGLQPKQAPQQPVSQQNLAGQPKQATEQQQNLPKEQSKIESKGEQAPIQSKALPQEKAAPQQKGQAQQQNKGISQQQSVSEQQSASQQQGASAQQGQKPLTAEELDEKIRRENPGLDQSDLSRLEDRIDANDASILEAMPTAPQNLHVGWGGYWHRPWGPRWGGPGWGGPGWYGPGWGGYWGPGWGWYGPGWGWHGGWHGGHGGWHGGHGGWHGGHGGWHGGRGHRLESTITDPELRNIVAEAETASNDSTNEPLFSAVACYTRDANGVQHSAVGVLPLRAQARADKACENTGAGSCDALGCRLF